jgi:Rrf2 family protein
MNNVRFATSIHILTLLAAFPDELLSSEYIAGSININAAIVRKEISNLIRFGLLESREGKGGGSRLAKPARQIRLSDVYEAVRQSPILGRTNNPNPACEVGRKINKHLDNLFEDAEHAMVTRLHKITLDEFSKRMT